MPSLPPLDETAPAPDGERPWLPLNALRAFEAVARRLSFTAAAASLHVSQSALSRHVGLLEDQLGQRLLERRPSGLALTDAGAALLPVVSRAFDRIGATLRSLDRNAGAPSRALSLHMPPTFLQVVGLSLLRDFRVAFPDILIDVTSFHGLGAPPQRDLDVTIVFDRESGVEGEGDLLWRVEQMPACAPALASVAAGLDLGAFIASNQLLHVKLEGRPLDDFWAAFARRSGVRADVRRGLAFETEALALQCAMQGDGVALVDPRMAARDLAEGRLVAPFPEARLPTGYAYFLRYRSEDGEEPIMALFRSWMRERFGAADP